MDFKKFKVNVGDEDVTEFKIAHNEYVHAHSSVEHNAKSTETACIDQTE